MPVDVLCVGHASWDVITYVDGYPSENSKAETDRMIESGGGPAANAAYLVSLWGVGCGLAAALGDDDYARRMLDEFKAVGTDISLISTPEECVTPVSLIVVNTRNGSRTIVNRKSYSAALRLDKANLIGLQPRVLLFDGHELDASLQALEMFPDAVSILDAGSLREGTRTLAAKVDYLVSSERFALQITGMMSISDENSYRECVTKLLDINRKNVVVTLGERGMIYGVGDEVRHMPAFTAKTVDTTAAGDIFHGAFTYGITKGMDLETTLRLSARTAAFSVEIPGGRTSIPPEPPDL